MDIAKVCLLGLAAVLLGLQFKTGKQEYSIFIGIAVTILIFSFTAVYLLNAKEAFSSMLSLFSGSETYFAMLLKAIGITWLCELSSGICKDAGYQSVAAQIELFGKISILLLGIPIINALMQTITGFSV